MCFTGSSCLGFPIKEAARIFAVVLCAVSVLGFAFCLFNVVIYIINGVVPWLMLAPLIWLLVQFVCFILVFSACKNKQPERMIPAVVFSAFGCFGMGGCVGWSTVLIIQQGYVSFFWFEWQIGWPVPAIAGVFALCFLYITVTMVIAFKLIKAQRIEMIRIAALPKYERGDWKVTQNAADPTYYNT